jgi:hypothetical protein
LNHNRWTALPIPADDILACRSGTRHKISPSQIAHDDDSDDESYDPDNDSIDPDDDDFLPDDDLPLVGVIPNANVTDIPIVGVNGNDNDGNNYDEEENIEDDEANEETMDENENANNEVDDTNEENEDHEDANNVNETLVERVEHEMNAKYGEQSGAHDLHQYPAMCNQQQCLTLKDPRVLNKYNTVIQKGHHWLWLLHQCSYDLQAAFLFRLTPQHHKEYATHAHLGLCA